MVGRHCRRHQIPFQKTIFDFMQPQVLVSGKSRNWSHELNKPLALTQSIEEEVGIRQNPPAGLGDRSEFRGGNPSTPSARFRLRALAANWSISAAALALDTTVQPLG